MPKAFNEIERGKIRERLIAAGRRLIRIAGTKLLVIDALAREAGISKGSFYSFFPSREDFILSVFESWEAEYRGELIREVLEREGSPQEKLERFFFGAFEIFRREPGLAKLGFDEIERLTEGLPPERIAAHQAADDRVLGETFAAWAAEGILDEADLAALPGIGRLLFTVAMHKDDFPPDSYEPAVRLLAQALAMRLARGGSGKGENR